MNNYLLSFFLLLLGQQLVHSQERAEETKAYLKDVVSFLASDSLRGRPCCSQYEKEASEFIATEMRKTNLGIVKFQLFNLIPSGSGKACKSRNVCCFVNNGSKKTVIIGAHYDHIGMGGVLSKSIGKSGIHPGADDNASGVALLLSLMKSSESWMNSDCNYLFVTYSAHEVGLFGSTAFAKLTAKKFREINLVLNFDMVGRMVESERWLVVYGGKEYKKVQTIFPEDGELVRGRMEDSTRLFQLDTKAFKEKGIPCLSFTTGIHTDYHKISDKESEINYRGIYQIQKKIEQFLSTGLSLITRLN